MHSSFSLAAPVLLQPLVVALLTLGYRVTRRPGLAPMEFARAPRAVRWSIQWAAAAGGCLLGLVWIDHRYQVVIAIYLPLVTYVMLLRGSQARVSVPALGWWFPWLIGPGLAWLSGVILATVLASSDLGWLGWLLAAVVALVLPQQVLALVATALRPILVAGQRLRLRPARQGRWVTSTGNWLVADVAATEPGVLLTFSGASALLPWPSGQPPRFHVLLRLDRDWEPPAERWQSLASHPGSGPITAAVLQADFRGLRAAIARLDEELVVEVAELQHGGDEFFGFITSLQIAGRGRTPAQAPTLPVGEG